VTRGDVYNDKNFQYLIIQHEIISCKKISFFKEKRKYFDYEKSGFTVAVLYSIFCCIDAMMLELSTEV